MDSRKPIVLVTGSSGFIGHSLVSRLAGTYTVVGLDVREPSSLPDGAEFVSIDLSSDDGVRDALREVRERHGDRIASVVHLAAYFDLTGQPNPKYDEITVHGTERLMRALQDLTVEQFIFSSTMLVHAPVRPGRTINEQRPLDPTFPYRASKIRTEERIRAGRGAIPVVYLRIAGVYDDGCNNPFLAQQIARIYERDFKSRFYPGDLATGQSFLHLDDLTEAVARLVERRGELPPETPLLVGEPDVMSYGELQAEVGRLFHGRPWRTWRIPRTVARAGAWFEDKVLGEDSFIKPWMVDIADDHYALDITRVRELLDWQPRHSLRAALPKIIGSIKDDPPGWYQANRLDAARVAAARVRPTRPLDRQQMAHHTEEMRRMHYRTLWAHFVNLGLGLWLITSPFAFGLFDPETARQVVRDVTAERGLPPPELRNWLVGVSDIISGVLIAVFSVLSLSRRFAWAQWANTAVGIWLLFAPLIFWVPSAAAYNNDTLIGTLVIAFAILVPMMPGMSHAAMADRSDTPPGWTYSPSTYLQRLPIIVMGLIGFLIARQLAAYQMGHVGGVWEPFFGGAAGRNGTETVITSDVSQAWPVADAGLGAVTYLFEVLMGVMGDRRRWRTMPWMVMLFGIVVVPLGVISIYFIIIQPIVIGTYCTLCLVAALAMLIMIPFALDELVAMGQSVWHIHRVGQPFWRTFFHGDELPGATVSERPGLGADLRTVGAHIAWGVTVPWTLAASAAVGLGLMFTPLFPGIEDAMADSNHLVGALVITVAFMAAAEVVRTLRFINMLFGLWLIAAPWLLADAGPVTSVLGVISGGALIGLSLPRGTRSNEHYGGWDRYVL